MIRVIILTFFTSYSCLSQNDNFIKNCAVRLDTLLLSGKYSYKDIYIQNPITLINQDTVWTAQKLYINDSLLFSEKQLHVSAFIVPLTKLNFKKGDSITLMIIQSGFNKIKILNP